MLHLKHLMLDLNRYLKLLFPFLHVVLLLVMLKHKLSYLQNLKPLFKGVFFKEFPLKGDIEVENINKELLKENILGGYDLGKNYRELQDSTLFCVTEKRSKEEIDKLVKSISNISKELENVDKEASSLA